MRKIDFRAWDKKRKEWTNFQIYLLDGSIRFFDKHIGTWFSDRDNKRFILEQYTGLKDKNGKEIYEGDILSPGYTVTFVDGHDPSNLGLSSGWYVQRDDFESWFPLIIGEDYEVIGNIHNNPELLEVEK